MDDDAINNGSITSQWRQNRSIDFLNQDTHRHTDGTVGKSDLIYATMAKNHFPHQHFHFHPSLIQSTKELSHHNPVASTIVSNPSSSPSSFLAATMSNHSYTNVQIDGQQLILYSSLSNDQFAANLIQETIGSVNVSMIVGRNTSDILNVSQDLPLQWAMVLFGYIMPLLFITTLIANSLVIIVLSQRHMRTPTNIVLLAMAISDLLTMIFPAPWYFYVYTLGYHSKLLHPELACYLYYVMMEVLPALFHTASIWLTLLLALQRYIYVCHPITARTWCTVPRVMKLMVWLYLISIFHQATRFADRTFTSVEVFDHGSRTIEHGCRFSTSDWVYFFDLNTYYLTYYGFRILFVHTLPITALVVLNLALFRALRRAQVARNRLFQQNLNRSESSRMRDSTNTTVMLIVVVTVFLATETPLAICTVLHVVQNVLDRELVSYSILNLVISITNFAIMCSYPVNFAIYCGMSLQFRETFKDLFIRGTGARGDNGTTAGDRSTMRRATEVQLLTTSRMSIPNGQRPVTETNL